MVAFVCGNFGVGVEFEMRYLSVHTYGGSCSMVLSAACRGAHGVRRLFLSFDSGVHMRLVSSILLSDTIHGT